LSFDYRPDGMMLWDPWFAVNGDTVHMFYQQRPTPGSNADPKLGECIGHAVSKDLINWQELPPALKPDPTNPLDDLWMWTGCAYQHDGRAYLYYTMRGSIEQGNTERIGLAISDDWQNWERYAGNPVIVPDPRYYRSAENPGIIGRVDCRDLNIIKAPENQGWLGFYAARVPEGECAETSVIACVRSNDLLNWEHQSIAYAPKVYGTVEVPDVFYLDEKWFMTCFTSTTHGNRPEFSDPHVLRGTVYATSDKPQGPYVEDPEDNTLLGGGIPSCVSCRSVLFNRKIYILGTEHTEEGYVLAPPMEARILPSGKLRPAYSDLNSVCYDKVLLDPAQPIAISSLPLPVNVCPIKSGQWELRDGVYHGISRTGWQTADLGVGSENAEISAELTLSEGKAAGLVYRVDSDSQFSEGDFVFALSAKEGCVWFAHMPDFTQFYRRSFPVNAGQKYNIKLSVRWPRFDAYIDDILVGHIAMKADKPKKPSIGMYVERGHAAITEISAKILCKPPVSNQNR
jgi:hypothetical protein